MTDRLFIRLTDDEQSPDETSIEWVLLSNSDVVAHGAVASLASIGDQLPPGKVIYLLKTVLIVPSEWVTLTQAEIPSKQARHILKALPYVLEEQLASDIEDLHFATGAFKKGEPIPVAVVGKQKMQHWIDVCTMAEIYPDRIFPDTLALFPDDARQTVLLLERSRALLRFGPHNGLAVAEDQLAIVLDSLFNHPDRHEQEVAAESTPDADDPPVTNQYASIKLLIGSRASSVETNLDVLQADLNGGEFGADVSAEMRTLDEPVVTLMAQQLVEHEFEKNTLNLLQNGFKVTKKAGSGLNIRWQPLAAAVAVFVVVHVGMMVGQARYYEQQALAYQQESVNLFKSWFPKVRRVKDVKRQLREELSRGGNGQQDQFMSLVYKSGEQVFALNRSASKDSEKKVYLDRVIYDEGQQNLRIDMRLSSLADLDTLKANLEAQGLTVQIDQATQDKDKVKARVRIKA